MQAKHNKQLISHARALRKEMTKEERHLWYDYLRAYPVRFSRQKVLGNYIVDFYCARAKLVIELDGSQHYEDGNLIYDAQRTAFLESYMVSRAELNMIRKVPAAMTTSVAVSKAGWETLCDSARQQMERASSCPWTVDLFPVTPCTMHSKQKASLPEMSPSIFTFWIYSRAVKDTPCKRFWI